MRTLGLSPLELRSIIEKAFLPLQCRCEEAADSSLNVWVEQQPDSGRMELVGKGVGTQELRSSRDINDLIARLRKQRNQSNQSNQNNATSRRHAAS
ncbi:DUF1652 domain-containing protein [Pseudomonas sp. KNUC1026]|uniref:DUF1652 domain-containing protein n=1 Tax=Pseudomonas sp. KNUC1026 TaxID=2893890 RepID=UPI001F37A77D|nr:DUF1652 domain-containing protein [Pseudomonas sp. KNUC1026]UFH51104.1 DUF1652 domain-containing protein [Pseudomonas sp. KNUC1026]